AGSKAFPDGLQASADGYSAEALFTDFRRAVEDFHRHTRRRTSNRACSVETRARIVDLHRSIQKTLADAIELEINGRLLDMLRALADEIADRDLGASDPVHRAFHDFVARYKQLDRMFPRLKAYRRALAKDRFDTPSADVRTAIEEILSSLGDRAVSGRAVSSSLAKEMRHLAKKLAALHTHIDMPDRRGSDGRRSLPDATAEAHHDAATRVLAIWRWLSDPERRLGAAGIPAAERDHVATVYRNVYVKLKPRMLLYIEFVLGWY
ncbi:hypothetical protein, partial [Rhodoplanes sp. SY1]|uniref:hypothetical protein n=1 Tax=Rhodoplanes sp. SY1 TaxID=3166646 RepID=UPI0038B45779